MQPRKSATDFPNPFSFVNAGVVPDHDDVSAEVAQQVPEELADLVAPGGTWIIPDGFVRWPRARNETDCH